MPSDQILIAIISAAGGVFTTYLVTRYKKPQKKSHMNEILDGFERLIKEQQNELTDKNKELDRKDKIIHQQQELNDKLMDIDK